MNNCRTCRYWVVPDEDWNEKQITAYVDPTTFEPITPPFEVRICRHPAQRFCERPMEKNGFALADGSTYFACLATAEEFGCALHEAICAETTD